MRRSAPAWIFTLVLYPLAVTQVVLAYLFWCSFNSTSDIEALVFPAIGCGLAIAEIFCLVVASEAGSRGETVKAWVLRALFVPLAVINLAADTGAIATFTGHDNAARGQLVARHDFDTERRSEISQELARLKATLQADGLDIPAAALAARRDALIGRRDRYIAEGLTPPDRLVREGARLESAHATALHIAELEEGRDQLDRRLSEQPVPAPYHEQFVALSAIANGVGLHPTPNDIRVALAFLLASILKATLALGFWGATPRPKNAIAQQATTETSDQAQDEEEGARSALPPFTTTSKRKARPLRSTARRASPVNAAVIDALKRQAK